MPILITFYLLIRPFNFLLICLDNLILTSCTHSIISWQYYEANKFFFFFFFMLSIHYLVIYFDLIVLVINHNIV